MKTKIDSWPDCQIASFIIIELVLTRKPIFAVVGPGMGEMKLYHYDLVSLF